MSENRNVTVKLKRGGWEIEITCAPEQLQKAVESVLSTLTTTPGQLPVPQARESLDISASKTCRGLILELWGESWFNDARSLSEVHEEISRRGYHYDRTAVSHSLTDLVRENVLSRLGTPRDYTYIQKRPSSTTGTRADISSEDSSNQSG